MGRKSPFLCSLGWQRAKVAELCQLGYLSEPGNKTILKYEETELGLLSTHMFYCINKIEPSWGLLKPMCREIDHMTPEMRHYLVVQPELGTSQEWGASWL